MFNDFRHTTHSASELEDDPSLKAPVLVVGCDEDGVCVLLYPKALDPAMNSPVVFGVILSDVIDHIGKYFSAMTGRDERDVRKTVMKVLRDENRFKEKDPKRVQLKYKFIKPKVQ